MDTYKKILQKKIARAKNIQKELIQKKSFIFSLLKQQQSLDDQKKIEEIKKKL